MPIENLVIGYESALDYWRSVRAACRQPDLEPTSGKVIGAMPLTLSQKARRAAAMCCTKTPLQIVVPDKQHRHNSPALTNRVFHGPLGKRQLISIDECIAVCGAEAIFTQLGADLSLPQLALIASEFCGSYGITPMDDDTVSYNLQPLSTINDLMAYAEGAKALGIRGASRAVNALLVTSEFAASPREAQIAVFLSLSRRRGGADLPGFELNKTIKVPAYMVVIVGSKILKPDFLWEHEKLILEYDSNEFHLSAAQKRRDEARRRVYERLGYKVKCLTSDILVDNDKLNVFVDELEMIVSPRRRKANQQMLAARRELRADLFGPERPYRACFYKTDWV